MLNSVCDIFNQFKNHINSYEFLDTYRSKKKYFTRKRKFEFLTLISFIINFRNKSTQIELDNFYQNNLFNNISTPTKNAFFKARLKIKSEAFLNLLNKSYELFYESNKAKKWRGLRLIIADGSEITIPLTGNKKFDKKLEKYFGLYKNQHDTCKVFLGHSQILYDPLNNMVISGTLTKKFTGERTIFTNFIEKLHKNDLVILDRGFPSHWLFTLLYQKKINFVIRLASNFNNEVKMFLKSNENEKTINIKITKKMIKKHPKLKLKIGSIKLRLIKIILDSGEIEILGTNLLDNNVYPNSIFKELYFLRWGIETSYLVFKNKLQLEWFSGKSVEVILQDFYSKLLQKNLFSLIEMGAEKKLKKNIKGRKYKYAINENIGYGILKKTLIELIKNPLEKLIFVLKKIINTFIKYIEPIRPNRKYERWKKRPKHKKTKTTIISFANRIAI